MRTIEETKHTVHDDRDLLFQLSNCGILDVHKNEECNDEFVVCGKTSSDDPLILTRTELKRLGFALVALSENTTEAQCPPAWPSLSELCDYYFSRGMSEREVKRHLKKANKALKTMKPSSEVN